MNMKSFQIEPNNIWNSRTQYEMQGDALLFRLPDIFQNHNLHKYTRQLASKA